MIDTILYLAIGFPLVAGTLSRFLLFDRDKFIITTTITASIFSMIGVGYAFTHYSNPPPIFEFLGGLIMIALIFAAPLIGILFLAKLMKEDGPIAKVAVGSIMLVLLFNGFSCSISLAKEISTLDRIPFLIFPAIATTLFFCVIGAIYSAIGPIVSGFTISSAIYAISIGNGIESTFLWKDFFSFFEISNIPVQITIMLVVSIIGATETIASLVDR